MEKRSNAFDELAMDLAGGLSRREALGRLAGGLMGALLATMGWERAWGAPPSRPSKCSDYCNTLPRPQRANCNNACKQCGGNTQNICPSLDSDKVTCCSQGTCCSSGVCSGLGTNQNCAACGNTCTGGQSCVNGTCQCPNGQPLCNGVCCNAGESCAGGSCVAAKTCSGDACDSTGGPCSSTNLECFCSATTEGANLCLDYTGAECGVNKCTISADCPSGSFCAAVACCTSLTPGQGICLPAGTCLT
jgi:hypothetical protein